MDIGKITQLAKTELGEHAKCVYHQDLTGPEGQNHLKVDEIGAGDLISSIAFLLVAVFERPTQTPLNPQHAAGTYAPNLMMNVGGTLTGATSQIRTDSVRLNVVPLGLNRPFIVAELRDKMVDPEHPSEFCLAFKVDRTATPAAGKALLFVGNENADLVSFDFPALDASTQIIDLRAGMGTANGIHYRAAVSLVRLQISAGVS